jgi:hypothetical protein
MLKQIKANPAGTLARIQALSHARLSNYRSFFGAADDTEALGLYQWNEELSAVLFRTISLVEVVLRNQFHQAMSRRYGAVGGNGSRDWYVHVALSTLSKSKIQDITHHKRGARPSQFLGLAARPSHQDGLDRPTQRARQHRTTTEPHDEVRPLSTQAQCGCEGLTAMRHFHRLVQEGVADAQGGGLQGEALVAAPDLDPVRLVGGLADEDRDAGGTAHLPRVLVVLALRGQEPAKRQVADPRRDVRVAGRRAVEPVARANGVRAVEADPAFNSLTKAASANCAVLPWITWSSVCSIAGRSVNSSSRTVSGTAGALQQRQFFAGQGLCRRSHRACIGGR